MKNMTNEKYYDEIKPKLESLEDLKRNATEIGQKVVGESLFKQDLFFCSVLDRFVKLTDGFKILIKNRNLTCSGAMLRLLLDNCMRLYGLSIAENINDAIDIVINGEKFDKIKDLKGNQLKDCYLKEQLTKFDERFEKVYNSTSGYIHFSDKGFFQSVRARENNIIEVQISPELKEEFNSLLIEGLDAYIYFSTFFLRIFDSIIKNKESYDRQYNEDLK